MPTPARHSFHTAYHAMRVAGGRFSLAFDLLRRGDGIAFLPAAERAYRQRSGS